MVVVQIVMSLTSYIPQIIKLVKRKSSEDISLGSWLFSLVDFGTYQVLLLLGDEGVILNCLNALQILQILLVIYLVVKYRKKNEETLKGQEIKVNNKGVVVNNKRVFD